MSVSIFIYNHGGFSPQVLISYSGGAFKGYPVGSVSQHDVCNLTSQITVPLLMCSLEETPVPENLTTFAQFKVRFAGTLCIICCFLSIVHWSLCIWQL